MTDDSTSPFQGVERESTTDGECPSSSPASPPTNQTPGSTPVDPLALARDLTLDEVHSFTIGFGIMLLATVATAGALLAPQLIGPATALWSTATLLALVAVGVKKAPTRTLRYLPREPHYFLGGAGIGAVVGLALVVPLAILLVGTTALGGVL